MKIEVKETPAASSHELLHAKEQRDGAVRAADQHRRTVEDCERNVLSLNAKIARLSNPTKEYVLTLSESEREELVTCLSQTAYPLQTAYLILDGLARAK